MEPLKIVFAGTPAFAAAHLDAVLHSRHQVLAVYTQPDRPAGRGKQLQASPVKQLAEQHQLPVFQPASLKGPEEQGQLAALNADLMVVVAYGLLLPRAVLDTPRFGCLNVHASLLPRWRGAAPIERALLAGDSETGITIMQMDAGLDTGDMLYQTRIPITEQTDRLQLESGLMDLGCKALLHSLDQFHALRLQAQAQDESLSTYASKLDKAEALIHWDQPAGIINRQVRAGIGRNPAYTFLQGERLRILKAEVRAKADSGNQSPGTILRADRDGLEIACADSVLRVLQLQLPGKNPVSIQDALNARSTLFAPGKRFQNSENAAS